MAEDLDMRGKAIRVNLGVEGQSIRDHTAGSGMASGMASEETTPVPAAESEAYSDEWHESAGSVSEGEPMVATPSQGTASAAVSEAEVVEDADLSEAPEEVAEPEAVPAEEAVGEAVPERPERHPGREVVEERPASVAEVAEAELTEPGYTSAYESDHSASEQEEEALEAELQAELAQKDEEHDQLARQLSQMQQEMESLRKILEQNQLELANSSQELEKARAELDDLRQQQNASLAASNAERDAFRQVEKLMKEKKALREQLEKIQDQMQRMEALQQQLERRLHATERERDVVKQRLQAEVFRPHRMEEADAARRRTGGEFRMLEKPAGAPRRRREPGPADVWKFQPRQRGALVLRLRPGIDSPRSGQKLFPGDSFVVSEQRKGPADLVFLKLADGRGWAFNKSPDVGTLCIPRPRTDRLKPYRLPEGARLPGKIRQDQAIRSRPRLPAIPKPVRDSRAPWH